jgi:hypothetical protein
MPEIRLNGRSYSGVPDMSNYYTKAQMDSLLDDKADGEGVAISIDPTTGIVSFTYDDGTPTT